MTAFSQTCHDIQTAESLTLESVLLLRLLYMLLISFVSLVSLAAAAGDGLTQRDDGTGRRFVMVQIPVSLDGETRCYARLHLAAGELEPPAAAAAAFCAAPPPCARGREVYARRAPQYYDRSAAFCVLSREEALLLYARPQRGRCNESQNERTHPPCSLEGALPAVIVARGRPRGDCRTIVARALAARLELVRPLQVLYRRCCVFRSLEKCRAPPPTPPPLWPFPRARDLPLPAPRATPPPRTPPSPLPPRIALPPSLRSAAAPRARASSRFARPRASLGGSCGRHTALQTPTGTRCRGNSLCCWSTVLNLMIKNSNLIKRCPQLFLVIVSLF